MKRAWFLVRRYWGIAGAILLLSSPLLYVLSTGPLFLLVRWPAQTGDYELSSQRLSFFRWYTEPLIYGFSLARNRDLEIYYNQYLELWKLPTPQTGTTAIEHTYLSPHPNLTKSQPQISPLVYDLTEHFNTMLGPERHIDEAIYIRTSDLIFFRGKADSVLLIKNSITGTFVESIDTSLHALPH